VAWTRGTRIACAGGLLETRVDEDLVVLDPVTGEYAGLDGTAAAIWGALAGPTTFGELVDRIAADHGVARSDCAPDIATYLESLRRKGLVTATSPDHHPRKRTS
jgi:hypothetical protein